MNGLVWLRSDLRIDDNPALNIADNECSKIACIYLLSEKEWKSHNNANVKLDFVIRNLSDLKNDLQKLGLGRIVLENTGNIGKSYRKHDEIGTPICITIDFDTLEDRTVTVRDRDTMEQKRVKIDSLDDLIKNLLVK
mgnify:CR=1 FL=1